MAARPCWWSGVARHPDGKPHGDDGARWRAVRAPVAGAASAGTVACVDERYSSAVLGGGAPPRATTRPAAVILQQWLDEGARLWIAQVIDLGRRIDLRGVPATRARNWWPAATWGLVGVHTGGVWLAERPAQGT